MASRMNTYQGHAPLPLLKKDLPPVAKALCMYPGGGIGATQQEHNGVTYIMLQGTGVNVFVLWGDWLKIVPWVKLGYFNTPIFPAGVPGSQVTGALEDPSNPSSCRYPFYLRTLEKLQELFPHDYPISDL